MNAAINERIQKLFSDPRVVEIREYLDGWVAQRYRWRAPGKALRHVRAEGGIRTEPMSYDRKRSHGVGPYAVAFSERGGRLASC